MKPLPEPADAGTGKISFLWEYINLQKSDQCLVLTYVLDCFRCNTEYPILVLLGLQGSGKSTAQDILRSLIDPSICNLRTAPRKSDDLVTEAKRNYLLSYNNVSSLTNEMSDDLCNISTGGGFSTRKFWTNDEQILFDISRPVMVNGIGYFIRRPDFLDRAIIAELLQMENRKPAEQLKLSAKKALPSIFGGLLDLMSKVLKILPSVSLPLKPPRMVDYALLGIAVEQALGLPKNTFISRYHDNRENAQESVIESSPVILALIDYIEIQPDKFWRGRLTDLLGELTKFKGPSFRTSWPEEPRKMGEALKRYQLPLKQYGIEVAVEPRKKNGIIYRISKLHTPHAPHTFDDMEPNNEGALDGVMSGVGVQNNKGQSYVHPHQACAKGETSANLDSTYDSDGSNVRDVCGVREIPLQHKNDLDESILI